MVKVRECENYRRLSKFNRGTLVGLHLRGNLPSAELSFHWMLYEVQRVNAKEEPSAETELRRYRPPLASNDSQ